MGRVLRVAVALAVFSLQLFAQNQRPFVHAPHKPVPRMVRRTDHALIPRAKADSIVGGLWMIDANLKSSIYLKNVVESDPVTVTPVLYLSNGNKYSLPDVKLEPAGTAVVDVNAALEKFGVASWATLSGYVEIQYTWPWDPLCATVRDVDTVHSVIFTYGLQPSISPVAVNKNSTAAPASNSGTSENQNSVATSGSTEGMWWKQESNVSGFVSLSNTLSNSVDASVQISDSQGMILGSHDVTISPHGTKIVNLSELQTASANVGGLHVTYGAPQGVVVVNGGLEDQASGYSAILPFASGPAASEKATTISIAELGLMVGEADPMMSFPAGTNFTPYSLLRNVSNAPVSVTPTAWWMQGGNARSAELQALTLLPGESKSLNVLSLLSAGGLKNYNGSLNLVFDTQSPKGSLLMAAGSVDQTNTYVFEVSPRAVLESIAKSLSYWSTKNGDDTMVTLWNPADEAQDLTLKLFFSGGHYLFPIHLGPRATQSLNVSQIIQNQIPDSEGNVIPASVQEGSAKIMGAQGNNEHILIATDAGTYNIRKATCGQVCFSCDGFTAYGVTANGPASLDAGFQVPISSSQQVQFLVVFDDNLGNYEDDTPYSSWSSSDTGVASVSNDPQIGAEVDGKSTGTADIVAEDSHENPPYVPYQCFPAGMSCPFSEDILGGDANVTVAPAFANVSLRASSGMTVSATDGESLLYSGTVGTTNLGMLSGSLGVNNACVAGNELVAAIQPTTYTGSVTIKREVVAQGCYSNNKSISCQGGLGDDTGTWFTTNPQETTPGGNADGHVYNLDAPGVFDVNNTTPIRVRFDFVAYAVDSNGTQISPQIAYYVRLSCKNNSSGIAVFSFDGSSSDNQIGLGTTPLTWNLQ